MDVLSEQRAYKRHEKAFTQLYESADTCFRSLIIKFPKFTQNNSKVFNLDSSTLFIK